MPTDCLHRWGPSQTLLFRDKGKLGSDDQAETTYSMQTLVFRSRSTRAEGGAYSREIKPSFSILEGGQEKLKFRTLLFLGKFSWRWVRALGNGRTPFLLITIIFSRSKMAGALVEGGNDATGSTSPSLPIQATGLLVDCSSLVVCWLLPGRLSSF